MLGRNIHMIGHIVGRMLPLSLGFRTIRVDEMVFMRFSCGMLLFLARVDESLMTYQQIAAGKGLRTDVAYEGFLFCVGADVSLEVFLFFTF